VQLTAVTHSCHLPFDCKRNSYIWEHQAMIPLRRRRRRRRKLWTSEYPSMVDAYSEQSTRKQSSYINHILICIFYTNGRLRGYYDFIYIHSTTTYVTTQAHHHSTNILEGFTFVPPDQPSPSQLNITFQSIPCSCRYNSVSNLNL
jgi:hypothetical protein